jgi:Carbohydrate binding domain (family 11)
MVFALRTSSVLVVVTSLSLSLSGCLVAFEDYPLGLGASGSRAAGGSDSGASLSGGTLGDSGSSSVGGDSALGGAATGGVPQGGAGSAMMPPDALLIDDFEDGDSQVALVAGRNGSWFAFNDGTGQQSPDPHADMLPALLTPSLGPSTRAMHSSGSGFKDWGATVGANFVVTGTTPLPYSISAHQGLTFSAKIGKPGSATQVRVSIKDYDTLHGCTSCGDHFGATVNLGDTFQTVQVPFASLKQQGWGKPQVPKFDPERAYAVVFGWGKDQTFDIWIDDLSFY